jgi:uncharacterized protein (DUF3820 family)
MTTETTGGRAGAPLGLAPETLAKARADMAKLASQTMPFGKFKGRRVIELPEEYLLWFRQKGFPRGELGRVMQLALELKINGLEGLIPNARRPGVS